MTRDERWEVLTSDALSELGLREVAEIIARLCRERKRQDDGRQRYAYAIAEWEHDLARLKASTTTTPPNPSVGLPQWRSRR